MSDAEIKLLVARGFELVDKLEESLKSVTQRIEQDWGLDPDITSDEGVMG